MWLPGPRAAANPRCFPCPVSEWNPSTPAIAPNANDCAAQLNQGSYKGIPQSIRDLVNRQFETFVLDSIARRVSFAVETTLHSSVTFDQASTARRKGFFVEMHYLALGNFCPASGAGKDPGG